MSEIQLPPKRLVGLGLIAAVGSSLIWLQPMYSKVPLYVGLTNMILVWLFLMIGMIDYLSCKIFLCGLYGVIALVGLQQASAALGGLVVGLVKYEVGTWQPITFGISLLGAKTAIQFWPLNIVDSLLGAVGMGAAFAVLMWLGRFFYRREVLGRGDLALAVVIGVALGFRRSLIALAITFGLTLLASVWVIVGRKLLARNALKASDTIAFGPFLIIGAVIPIVWPV